MSKPVWFPFYPGDFLASNKVALMSTDEIGAYLLLLCHQWNDPTCTLPGDTESVQKLSRSTTDLTRVLSCFKRKRGRLVNERLYKEWQKAQHIKQVAREKAVKMWQSRSNAAASAPALPEACSSPSPSPSPSPSESPPSSSSQSEKKKICRDVKIVPTAKSGETWTAYAVEYRKRYGVDPVRNKTVNALLCQLVDKLGVHDAPLVAGFYVHHPGQWYVQKMHPVNLLVADAEKLRTECFTGNIVTNGTAKQIDQTATRGQVFRELLQEERAKHERSTR